MAKHDFNKVALQLYATLLKLHFGMGILLQICCIFLEWFFVRTPLEGCFCDTYEFKADIFHSRLS